MDTGICFIYSGYYVSNRCLKNMLIDQFGDEICFTYFDEIAEALRVIDPIKSCAKKLREEC